MPKTPWLDRAILVVAPRMALRRLRARTAHDLLRRHFEGAAVGRRTAGWNRSIADANAATGPYVGRLRAVARDLVRNNTYAESALCSIVDDTVGYGIAAKPLPANAAALATWRSWAESTACDADGRDDFAGLQKLVMREVAEAGEVLVRRRFRRPEDGLPVPFQLQVLEADFLDTSRDGITTPGGGRIVCGVEFDAIGRRVAYWLYPEHPGNASWPSASSQRIPADGILHIFKRTRAGAVRGASWFAPAIVRFKDFDEYEDATLMKQKIAACLAAITTDPDGTSSALGTADDTQTPPTDMLEPGMLLNAPAGRSIQVVQPPSVQEYPDYTAQVLRSIASGLRVTYEDMTGDFTDLPFSAARMSRLRHWAAVDDWRWRLLIPQFCIPVWGWVMQAAAIVGLPTAPAARWTPPPMPMIEPDKEGLAYQRNVRTGIQTLSEAIRERGYDPDELLAEMAADNEKLDALELVLDSDARKTTQAGQLQQQQPSSTEPTTVVEPKEPA